MISAIVVAGGTGRRFGGERPKQLAPLSGKPVLSHSLAAFELSPLINEIILVLPPEWSETIEREAVLPFSFKKVKVVQGGNSRTHSGKLGFEASNGSIVLIHDGVRPLLDGGIIERVVEAVRLHGAAVAAIPARDTLKAVTDGFVEETLDRNRIWQIQTPQGFKRDILEKAFASDMEATDDASLVEMLGGKVAVVEGAASNIKITTQEDLKMVTSFFEAVSLPPIRVGHGYDIHRVIAGRPLWLACVNIPHEFGLAGHSDADVMAHALADAVLGAAALGDIGLHFPDKDLKWKGAPGRLLLEETMMKVRRLGYEILNCDLTLIGEKPKIGPYRQQMRENIASALKISAGQVNIKASTTEGLDSVGQEIALASTATAVLCKIL